MSDGRVPPPGVRTRRAALRRRRQQQRRRMVLAALAVGVALTLLLTWYLAARDTTVPAAADGASRTQRTLLLQLQGAAGDAVGTALLAYDPQGQSAGVLVPSQVLATAPGSGPLPYGEVLGTFGPAAARKALADLVGVTIDADWVLDLAAATRLVDAVGGVTVSVDVPVVTGTTVLLQPGEQRVGGAAAVAFATFLADGEPEQARLARLQELLDGLLEGLPGTSGQVARLLEALGPGSAVQGTGVPGLADTLVGMAADAQADALQYDTLPVVLVDTGAPTPSLRLGDGARALVDRLLPASVPDAQRAAGNRVLVFNGVGTPLLGDRVRDALAADGLLYVPGGNATSFAVATTEVQVAGTAPEQLELGRRVARALGVPGTAVRIGQPTSVADVVVVIGADFAPASS